MKKLLFFVLFGPLLFGNHILPTNTANMTDLIDSLEQKYFNLRKLQAKKTFLNKCVVNNVLPTGISLSLNLALGVNDPNLVNGLNSHNEVLSNRRRNFGQS